MLLLWKWVYTVSSGSTVLASGGSFGSSESTNFCLGGGSSPTCDDGIQNGDETGVDCGGSSCPACPTCDDGVQNGSETGIDCGGPDCAACPTCSDGIQNGNETGVDCGGPDCAPCGGSGTVLAHYFESGWDGWQDGGSDCYRYAGSRSYEGSYSIRLRDNSSSSDMTSSSYNVSGYSSLSLEFYFYAYSMESGEDFFVEYYDGSSWNVVANYASGTSFNNNTFYVATIGIDGGSYNMASNAQFRFRCDASNNSDYIYIDAVTVTGNSGGSRVGNEITALNTMSESLTFEEDKDFTIFPNPVSQVLNIESEDPINSIRVLSITGEIVTNKQVNQVKETQIDVSTFHSGIYLISIETDEEVLTQKFVKQ